MHGRSTTEPNSGLKSRGFIPTANSFLPLGHITSQTLLTVKWGKQVPASCQAVLGDLFLLAGHCPSALTHNFVHIQEMTILVTTSVQLDNISGFKYA